MKVFNKKYMLPVLLVVIVLTGWEGLGAGYNAASRQQEIIPSSAPALIENKNAPVAVINVSSEPSVSESSIEQSSRNIISTNARWTLEQIGGISSLKIKDTAPVLIAVLDTGIDTNHEDLSGKVVAEINFTQSNTIDDIYGHGTSVAGIIAADEKNDLGINGIAPASRLLNVKVADDSGRCQSNTLAEGIIWAVDNGARVINISLEIQECPDELKEAVDYAWEKGAVIIAAAGNDGSSSPVYPAGLDNCLAVTAVKDDDTLVPLANYGNWVDVSAPGYKIYTTLPGNAYGYCYGTSFAAACISGLAGNLFSIVEDNNGNGRLNDEIREIIEAGYNEFGSLGK